MKSLKIYIKDNFALTSFYSFGFIFAVIWTFIKTTDFFAGETTTSTIKLMLCIPFFPIVGWYYLSEVKKLILVLLITKNRF